MQLNNKTSMIAFILHCGFIIAFAILGGLFHEISIYIFILIYSGALIFAYSMLLNRMNIGSNAIGKRLIALHLIISVSLIVLGTISEKIIPIIGGAVSYVSVMSFYLINYPGLPISKLLPYPGNPELMWQVFRYIIQILVTMAWLFIALRFGDIFKTKRQINA